MLLTDDDLRNATKHISHNDLSVYTIGRAVIAAYEAKLREQEPVAIVDDAGVIIVCSYSYKPGDKLFANPAPIPEGFDSWSLNPYTIALQKSIAEDYVPKSPMAAARSGE